MADRSKAFLMFLLKKYNSTGKTSFSIEDYGDFSGYESAIDSLRKQGLIKNEGTIVGTITLVFDAIEATIH